MVFQCIYCGAPFSSLVEALAHYKTVHSGMVVPVEPIDIRQSTADPLAMDTGNKRIQGRTVSKTIQLALFTCNANAVWAERQMLQKISYPFAPLKIVVNRSAFRYEVGDCFKFSYAQYPISEMIFRVIQKEEENIESENITIYALEDMFSATRNITSYIEKIDHRQPRDDYNLYPFVYQMIMEAPYVIYQDGIALLAAACRMGAMDLGFQVYMSIDGGASYSQIGTVPKLLAYGQLVGTYPLETYPIDPSVTDGGIGFIIEFANANDVAMVETTTWGPLLAGQKNTAIFMKADGTYETVSFLSIAPVTGLQYRLEGIIRNRFGSEKQAHSEGEKFWILDMDSTLIINPQILAGVTRKFKFVPYNIRKVGDIPTTAIDLVIEGEALKPYRPTNFMANGSPYVARYDTDIILTWSPRYRGQGAGIELPGIVAPILDWEGLFSMEVWEDGVPKPTIDDIDDITYTYTPDPATTLVLFKLSNYREQGGIVYESSQAEVICKKN